MKFSFVIACTLFAIGLAGLIAGCRSNNDNSGPKGSLAIAMGATRAPSAGAVPKAVATADRDDALSRLQAAVITMAGVEARMADGTWVPMETGLPVDTDVIAVLYAGSDATLPADFLPEGDYDALELRITEARLTLLDGTKVGIAPTGAGWTVLVPVSFSVAAGESTTVKLQLQCASSFKLFDGELGFDPDFEVEGVERG